MMIKVTVELIPKGVGKPELLGIAHIFNDLSGDAETGNYGVILLKSPKYSKQPRVGVWKTGEVTGFPRQRLGPWDLLYRALKNTVGDRNK